MGVRFIDCSVSMTGSGHKEQGAAPFPALPGSEEEAMPFMRSLLRKVFAAGVMLGSVGLLALRLL